MALIDEVTLQLKAGDGGNGVVRWRSEKFKPKAGPGGGNGGRGGDVYAEVVSDLGYLDYYLHKKSFAAQAGDPGGKLGMEGKNGEDIILKFPRGSVLINKNTGEEMSLDTVGEKILLLKGGQGGLGNQHFKSSTNTTPMEWTPGKPGETAEFFVELRLFAEIGIIGLPSAGKSTLLNALTNAKSKVAAYHFTTLDPHLGDMHGHILADIPGIIEGAADGKGLGHKFLKHIKRTEVLLHVISLESEYPFEDYNVIRNELAAYDKTLLDKKELILLSKSDAAEAQDIEKLKDEFAFKVDPEKIFVMSAYDDESIAQVKKELIKYLENK
ncbi:GTPase ObgE [Candidatus Campbellbacteria bacterium]|nr:GTPase ObgE [Candidatus Campbellbacteria bacterium]|tara:strand:+ start:30 stop:1007 length:978 start_codon:yes stop_codon:yes gene_type:complete